MRIKTRLIFYIGVIVAYFLYKVIRNLEIFKSVPQIQGHACEVIQAPHGGEDVVLFKDTFIFSGDDRIKMEHPEYQLLKTPDGQLFGLKEGTSTVYEIKRVGFPAGVAFHPHGTFLRGSKIYVINHAYSKGGERIDIFNLVQSREGIVEAHFVESFIFGADQYGIFNDLVVISDDEYYITQWMSFPEGDYGKSSDFMSQLKFMIPSVFNFKWTHVYYCKRNICKAIKAIKGEMFNGIDWDEDKRLFVTSTTDKQVYELEFNREHPENPKLLRVFDLNFNSDNLFYDRDRNEILVASIAKAIEFLKYKKGALKDPEHRLENAEFYTGYEIIDLNSGKVFTKMMQKDLIYGISSAFRHNGKVYLGTWTDNRIVVCKA
jgi:hypothetical protein